MSASVPTIPEKLPLWRTERECFGTARLCCASSRVAERCAISDKSLLLTSLLCNYVSATQLSLGCWRERKRERERMVTFFWPGLRWTREGAVNKSGGRSLSLSEVCGKNPARSARRLLRNCCCIDAHRVNIYEKSHGVRSRISLDPAVLMWSEGSRLSFVGVVQTNIKARVEFKGW